MRRINTLLLFAFLVNPLACLAAADTAPAGNRQSYLVAQVDQRRDESRPAVQKEVENRVQSNRDSSGGNSRPSARNDVKNAGITKCPGEFALCAASTCKPTGRMIKVKEADGKTTKEFPESVCTCPIINQAIADMNQTELAGIAGLNEGNMNGSCDSAPGKIWSLFSPLAIYPQESTDPPFQIRQTNPYVCNHGKGSNCWSYECTIDKEPAAPGVRTATCACPIGENPFGGTTQSPGFRIAAGAYFKVQDAACDMYPVSIPDHELTPSK